MSSMIMLIQHIPFRSRRKDLVKVNMASKKMCCLDNATYGYIYLIPYNALDDCVLPSQFKSTEARTNLPSNLQLVAAAPMHC